MDILRELNDEELQYITEELKSKLPDTLKDLNYILTVKRNKDLVKKIENVSENFLPTFYTHRRGLKENCTFFAITGAGDHNVWIFSFEENLSEVTECLEQTSLIRWKDKILFDIVDRKIASLVIEQINKNNYKLKLSVEGSYYYLKKEKVYQFDLSIPDGTYLKKLTETDVKFCTSTWEWSSETTENFVRTIILIDCAYGLCDKSTDEILSFGTINHYSAISMLYTVEHARGKKYGEFIAKYLAVKIAEDFSLIPNCCIVTSNIASEKLFNKLGYERICDITWVVVEEAK
ncbi:CLUMA_CG003400, isoform A [Clunio marinus]|uniref:CLUMA_CG003400, isoform A n=1 Tax=Clunio marinus TaxID=568069 RepID=A0A1J1HTF7_9DIPT|nr:CLUMA_CG003400, isoform A [Clunio marinus]